jgi:antitoxin HigA-1
MRVELPALLEERGVSLRKLAQSIGVNHSYLSRVLGAKGARPATAELAAAVARALELPDDYFPEYREAFVISRVREDPALRDRLYDRLRRDA